MKKILALSLCLTLLLSLTACGISDIKETIFGKDSNDFSDFYNNDISVPSSPSVVLPDTPKTSHTPVAKENYYQYSLLSDTDKNLYNDICTAIEKQQNFVDVEKYNLTESNVQDVYHKVVADNPQYFWLSKFMEYSYYTLKDETTITHLILAYTDGEITDEFDKNNKFVNTADREKIKSQKIAFDNKATAFLNTISKNISIIEKERLIHDFVLKAIKYADKDKDKKLTRKNYMRIYDLYGALVGGSAVCEGYAKLFQYLCCQVGINTTAVYGWSEGESHAWNIVKLEKDWYHVDTTWDDGSTDNLPLYSYFNLTEKELSKDHVIDKEIFPVPNATGTKYSFINTYGVIISRNSQPKNYEAAIDYLYKYNQKYLVLVCNGNMPNQIYLNRYCFASNCDLQKYIKVKGYNISFEKTYYTVDNYIYLVRK